MSEKPDPGESEHIEGEQPVHPEGDLSGQQEADLGHDEDERTPAEQMRSFETLMERGDLRSIDGHLDFWNTMIDGDGGEPGDTLQTPLNEADFPPEVVGAIKNHRQILKDAREAIQRNVDIIKAAVAEAAPAQQAHDIERQTAELNRRKAELEAYRARPEGEKSAHDIGLLENQVKFAEEDLEEARSREV